MTQNGIAAVDQPKYLGASSSAYHRVQALAQSHTDAEIAEQLNAEALLTMKGKPWTTRRVMTDLPGGPPGPAAALFAVPLLDCSEHAVRRPKPSNAVTCPCVIDCATAAA